MTAEHPALRASDEPAIRQPVPLDWDDAPRRPPASGRTLVGSATALWDFRRRLDRRHLGLAVGAVIAVWLVFVFSRAAGEAVAVNEQAASVRAEIAELRARLDEARREVEVIQSDRFVLHRARGFGMGEIRERAFSLAPGSPPAPRIDPLGEPPDHKPTTPLEDWIRLLSGS